MMMVRIISSARNCTISRILSSLGVFVEGEDGRLTDVGPTTNIEIGEMAGLPVLWKKVGVL